MAQYLSKEQVVERICNRTNDIQKLKDEIDIDNYVEVKPQNVKGIYGVNVRLKGDVDILPFISKFGIDSFDTEKVAEEVKLYIPFFIKEKEISEIKFECKVQDEDGRIESLKVKTCKDLKGNDKTVDEEIIKNWLNQPNTFLRENIKALRYSKGVEIYVWITGEDYDPETNGTSFLSNTLAIFNDEDVLDKTISKRLDIVYFLFLLKSRYLAEMDLRRKIAAEKSAKAAIMSRNMSHNLGSHVMAYLKQKLGSVAAITSTQNDVLKNFYPADKPTSVTDVEFPFLVGLGKFIGYLQERQDYIATIATDYIPYSAPVNMKDAIYDELNPDLRYIRHKDDTKNRPLNILLSYIAKSEGLSRENYNHIDFTTHDDILFSYVSYKDGKTTHFGRKPDECDSDNPALKEMRKINFSLPGGLVGRQAIFSIIENLIRNAAKHGNRRSLSADRNLCFEFDMIDGAILEGASSAYIKGGDLSNLTYEQQMLPIRIGKELFDLYDHSEDIDDLYLMTITDNLDYSSNLDLPNRLSYGIGEDYIEADGRMKDSNKGIKELRISSAWMRGESNEELFRCIKKDNSKRHLAPIVTVELTQDYHLRYIFAIRKDHTVGYLQGIGNTTQFDALASEDPIKWHKFESIEEIIKERNSYRYILVPPELYDTIRPYVSNRLLGWSEDQSLDGLSSSDMENRILSRIYQLKTKLNATNGPDIYIWDQKAHEEATRRGGTWPKIKIFGASDNNDNFALYAYRTHHATFSEYQTYWNKKNSGVGYSSIISIDAITGDNSSDRLVRREPLDEQWYYGHLFALQQKVAIIDERIFRNTHQVDENLFTTTNSQLDAIREGLEHNTLSLDDAIDMLIENKIDYDDIKNLNSKELISYIAEASHTFSAQTATTNNHLTAFNAGRLVDIFTIVDDGQDGFILVGCTSSKQSTNDSLFSYTFDCVATINFDPSSQQIVMEFKDSSFKQQYNYISIHQGLLDKIYSRFGIKTHNEENDKAKCEVTKTIFKELMVKENKILLKEIVDKKNKDNTPKTYEYLPNFIIHSGRSKPSEEDMPQQQPFVQFSAIEHATKDCKYSLIQVLDYAKYE